MQLTPEYELALSFNLPIFLELPTNFLSKDVYKHIPYHFAKEQLALPLKERNGSLLVALADPLNTQALEELRTLLPYPLKPAFAPKELLLQAIEQCYNQTEGTALQLIADLSKKGDSAQEEGEVNFDNLLDDRELAPIIKLLNVILSEAIQLGSSDIHFEPFENDLQVRYRIDGVLQKRHSPPKEYQSTLMTRLKVMAKLDIAEHRLPQDGRIKLLMGERSIDLRISTIPVAHGERIVLRILDKGNITLGLNFLGMPKSILHEFKQLIKYPEGIILVTGPTGSGKTTTLYSAISEIHNDEINIMTIEDPIEYKLPGIAQMNVNQKIKLDFATGLRHILRQDPDVILIGEIRDRETAEIAVQSSLTGHLVFSTLHTNDAPSAITRLVDMGIEPYLLSSSLIAVLAQRLVRHLCPNCKYPYTPTQDELQEIGLKEVETLYKSSGCTSCFHSGFRGRLGIYELMTLTSILKKAIIQKSDSNHLRELSSSRTLLTHGRELVQSGLTTIPEILRILRT